MRDVVAPYRIQVLHSRAEIEALRDFWNSCCPGRDADLDFYLLIAALSVQTLRPHVVVLFKGNTPKAVLAGRLEEARVAIKAGYYVLPTPRLRILRFVYRGCLGELTDETAKMFVGSITASLASGEADAALIEHVEV